MTERPSSAPVRPVTHPLVLAVSLLIVVRALGLILHFLETDPNGNAVSASPLNSLLIALPYNGLPLLAGSAVLLTLWKLLPPLRLPLTTLGIAGALTCIVVGQVDLGLQWFIGQRFNPMVSRTYLGRELLTNDFYGPVLYHPAYLAIALILMLGPWVFLGWNLYLLSRGRPVRAVSWRLVTVFTSLLALCQLPVLLAYGHQRDVLRPVELLFADHWLNPSSGIKLADEPAAIANLRLEIDPSNQSRWLDPAFPLVRAAAPRGNQYLAAGVPAPRPDIVIFTIESLRGSELGYIPGNDSPGGIATPNLDQLARQGVVFSHYIANGNPSPRGFISINAGVWDHRESFIISGSTGTELDALPARLRDQGYFTFALWGTNPSFDNQFFWAKKWYDQIRYPSTAAHLAIMHSSGDDVIVDQLIEEISEHDRADDRTSQRRPIFAYVATAGTHEPYVMHGNTHVSPETIRAVDAEGDPRLRYRLVLRTLDAQIGRFLAFLKTRPPGRPVVIVVVGDHSDVAGDAIPPAMRGLPNNAVVWTGALIAGPAGLLGPEPRVETFPASHADLTPTLLDLAGDHRPTESMGTNLLADIPASQRQAIAVSGQGYRLDREGWSLFIRRDQPSVIWSKRSFSPVADFQEGLKNTPFSAADARLLWENFNTWSYLLEHDRVWRRSELSSPR